MRFGQYHAAVPLIPAFSLREKENWVPSLVHISVYRQSIDQHQPQMWVMTSPGGRGRTSSVDRAYQCLSVVDSHPAFLAKTANLGIFEPALRLLRKIPIA